MKDFNLENRVSNEASSRQETAALFGIKEEGKIEQFESMLSEDLFLSDSISEASEKIVRAALCAEFGKDFLGQKIAKNMIRTISAGIMSDSELRRQALLIMDRFAKAQELNA